MLAPPGNLAGKTTQMVQPTAHHRWHFGERRPTLRVYGREFRRADSPIQPVLLLGQARSISGPIQNS